MKKKYRSPLKKMRKKSILMKKRKETSCVESSSLCDPLSVSVHAHVFVLNFISYTQNGRMFLEQPSMSQPVVVGNIVKNIVYILTGMKTV